MIEQDPLNPPSDPLELWLKIKEGLLKKNLTNRLLGVWLQPIRVYQYELRDKRPHLVLSVPSELHKTHIVENLMDKIFIEAKSIVPDLSIDLIVQKAPLDEEPYLGSNSDLTNTLLETSHKSLSPKKTDFLDPNFTFSTFVVGRNSEFAHAACYNVAVNPGQSSYNPLLICGPVGMGKTHLLHAVGHEILQRNPQTRIIYMQGERFLNEFVAAMRYDRQDEFRHKYRDQVDVLLFDDIQFIVKGVYTQEEFFHIFNSLIMQKKQIILASDRRPKDILKLEDRNRSRLEWGLTVEITMPDFETRIAILRFKAEQLNLRLTDDVVTHIAKVAKRSIREIEGALKTLKMFSELQGVPIDLNLTKKILVHQENTATITPDDIIKLVSEQFRVSVNDLKSTSRAKPIVVPRQIAMFLIKKHLGLSFVEIGRLFGNRDHTTVMNAIEKIQVLHNTHLDIRNHIEDLTNQIHNITGV